jgi:hypothetical protein
MKQLVEKLVAMEREISEERGTFALFALFLREDALDKWDLVASAPWLEEDKKESLAYLSDRLRSHLTHEELLSFSRIVLIDRDNPFLEAIRRAVSQEHGIVEVKDSNFFGLEISHAYIITSKRQQVLDTQSL